MHVSAAEHKLITVNKHFGSVAMIIILILLASLCILGMELSKIHQWFGVFRAEPNQI